MCTYRSEVVRCLLKFSQFLRIQNVTMNLVQRLVVFTEEELMSKPKYLTKSRFKIARDCVTKLHYSVDKNYASNMDDDAFLQALAEGGYQVGELAKFYYPGGFDIKTINKDEALAQTNAILKAHQDVVIYEAAILYDGLYIRVDILCKKGNLVQLIEVKAKSADSDVDKLMIEKKVSRKKDAPVIDAINPDFTDYIYDVAFQTYVARKAFPDWEVTPYLMLADKSKRASISGLNQFFLLTSENGQVDVKTKENLKRVELGKQVLGLFDADPVVNLIFRGNDQGEYSRAELEMESFEEEIQRYKHVYETDGPTYVDVSRNCKGCEFRCSAPDKKNGFNECWTRSYGLSEDDLNNRDMIFGIWNLHYGTTDRLLEDEKLFIDELTQDDIEQGKPGKSKDRQWLQVKESNKDIPQPSIDIAGLSEEMANFVYPLHFIDFETSMVAIPFFEGQKPYEQVAFQFSHHMMHEDGKIEHLGEFISNTPGEFPNFEFIRELKRQLEGDAGTIFKFAPHENTVLCQIYFQLEKSNEPDKVDLQVWIETVTKYKKNGVSWEGERNMIDMCKMVKDYYWDPYMKGSNSIKVVLPAVLNSSKYLKEKYQKPIYGNKIKSLNFKDLAWIKIEDGEVVNPYFQLPQVFEGLDLADIDLITRAEKLKDGAAAMTAYARMQFTEMTEAERNALSQALLRYCELDTMAMVMIMEAWMDWCEK